MSTFIQFFKNLLKQPETIYALLIGTVTTGGVYFFFPLPILTLSAIGVGSLLTSYFSLGLIKEGLSLYRKFRDFLTHSDEAVVEGKALLVNAKKALAELQAEAQASLVNAKGLLAEARTGVNASLANANKILGEVQTGTQATLWQVNALLANAQKVTDDVDATVLQVKDQNIPHLVSVAEKEVSDARAQVLERFQPLVDEAKNTLTTARGTIETLNGQLGIVELRASVLTNLQEMTRLMQEAEKTLKTVDQATAKLKDNQIPDLLKQVTSLNKQLTTTLKSVQGDVTNLTEDSRSTLTGLTDSLPALKAKLDTLLDTTNTTVIGLAPKVEAIATGLNSTMHELQETVGGVNNGMTTLSTLSAPVTAVASGFRTMGSWIGFGGDTAANSTTPDEGRYLEAPPLEEANDSAPAIPAPATTEEQAPAARGRRKRKNS